MVVIFMLTISQARWVGSGNVLVHSNTYLPLSELVPLHQSFLLETVYLCKTCVEQLFLQPPLCFEMNHTQNEF